MTRRRRNPRMRHDRLRTATADPAVRTATMPTRMASVRHAIEQFAGCSEAEKQALAKELAELESISQEAGARAASRSCCSARSTPASRR